ncbi:epidermal growth factor receptor kinase substrate 8-like [Chrysoperla carnea]|uniref:epidermal growth factor receptor kinase substrate 8-like n=1 Tax=Chrysoperla carnea TaxID=189513 RepID=UPI001D083E01|nr:epidermal growth factor receptor kinase substrate 8-like [Chrysoperla carnea]XP_044742141.1 epidermal growth factor receptor kinase substrate 8-like [Chrysoperla carnea]
MAYRSNGDYNSDEGERDPPDNSILSDDSEKPTYLMEHLATFTVTKETDVVYPADGMRRLLQLEKTNGIWSQKMQLCLDRQWVLIMDYETGSVMERFPASMIQEPTAFTSHDPMEIYNNILVFIVGKNGSNSDYNQRSEMHIFQCQSISAQDLVEDLKDLRAGKMLTRNRNSVIPGPPTKSPSPRHDRQRVNTTESNFHRESYRESDIELNDETSSIASEKYERDVTILNHCFDDIEKFIARLQHVAAASRELERRRRNRKSKKRDLGDGILTMRTKPPPERDFIDIFQKFKLSFNLLAKLKAHIHDPNAPELVHFLFTPLALIVDASHETYYEPNLPAKVISPLLTREAINLLINCVTSKETELWHSLGSAWLTSRDQWKGNVPSYHPVFLDGWSPDFPVVDEHEPVVTYSGKSNRDSQGDLNYGSDYFGYEQPLPEMRRYMYDGRNPPDNSKGEPNPSSELGIGHMSLQDLSARSDISLDSIERSGVDDRPTGGDLSQEAWLEELQAKGANVVQVTYPRTANNDKELTVVRGEYLEVLDDSRKWWKARNIHGKVAHVPHTIVTQQIFGLNSSNNDPNEIFNNPLYIRNVRGNIQREESSVSGRYSAGASNNSHEHAAGPPHPQSVAADRVRKEHLETYTESSFLMVQQISTTTTDNSSTMVLVPPPPPMPVTGGVNSASVATIVSSAATTQILDSSSTSSTSNANGTILQPSTNHQSTMQGSSTSQNEGEMHDELRTILPLIRQNKRNLDILKTPEVYIRQVSSPSEVQQWLRAKGFTEQTCDKLKGLTGNELLALNRSTLEQYCGQIEGKRLASQIIIQRNVSGYKTARTSELLEILARARRKVDNEEVE